MDDEDLTPDEASEDELWALLDEATGVARAQILHELGGRAFADGEYEQSVVLAESAAAQARDAGDALLTARSLFGQAAGLRKLGRTEELIDVAMEAADLLRANGEPAEIAECHEMVAFAFSDLGDDATAVGHWSSAAALFESEDLRREAGRMHMSLGEALGRLGRKAEALATFDHARELFRAAGEPANVPWADDRAAAALIDLGRVEEALERLRAALSVRLVQRDVARTAYAHYRLGWTLRLVGQHDDALHHLGIAAGMFDVLEELAGRARCDLEAANALTSKGGHEEAEDLYRRTRAVFDALGLDAQVVLCDANRAVLLSRTGRLEEAADLNAALLERVRGAGLTWLVGDIGNHLARNLIDLERADEALAVISSLDEHALDASAAVQAASLRARALLATGRRSQAARAAEEGLRLAADAELIAERAELHETRGLARLAIRPSARAGAADRDLAHAVALYLAAGLTEKARELSTRFLPQPGMVQRDGGLISEQPTLPRAEPDDRSEPSND
jgi:tetratricopeptide (TPR) repeat protein